MTTFDRQRDHAESHAIAPEQIPVIDLGPLAEGPEGQAAVGRAMRRASTDIGFFYVRNHGIPAEVLERAVAASRRFFALPPADKQAAAVNERHRGWLGPNQSRMYKGAQVDLKESFNFGLELAAEDPAVAQGPALMGPNNWPVAAPDLRPAAYGYYEAALACGRRMLSALALALDLPADWFASRFTRPIARGSLLYYPPQPADLGRDHFGVGPHTDYGCLTLLWQDQNGGLEVRARDGRWVMAPPLPDTLVINVGDLLARWSNDRFVSTPHRVVNRSGRERYSIAVFFDPNFDAIVDPRDLPGGGDPLYPPVGAGAHILGRFDAAFAYRQRQEAAAG